MPQGCNCIKLTGATLVSDLALVTMGRRASGLAGAERGQQRMYATAPPASFADEAIIGGLLWFHPQDRSPRLHKSREYMYGEGGIWKLPCLPEEGVPEVSCGARDSAIICELLSQP